MKTRREQRLRIRRARPRIHQFIPWLQPDNPAGHLPKPRFRNCHWTHTITALRDKLWCLSRRHGWWSSSQQHDKTPSRRCMVERKQHISAKQGRRPDGNGKIHTVSISPGTRNFGMEEKRATFKVRSVLSHSTDGRPNHFSRCTNISAVDSSGAHHTTHAPMTS